MPQRKPRNEARCLVRLSRIPFSLYFIGFLARCIRPIHSNSRRQMKTINIKTHSNYVFSFTDGSVKVGVTSRPKVRLQELCRKKRGFAKLKEGMFTPVSSKEAAFKTEADLCRLLRYMAENGAKEWFNDDRATFSYMSQTTGMFWILNNGNAYSPVKVNA